MDGISNERKQFSDFCGVGGSRNPSEHFSITAYHSLLSFGSLTCIPPSAHAREIRKLIPFIWHSICRDSVCIHIESFDIEQFIFRQVRKMLRDENLIFDSCHWMERFNPKSFWNHHSKPSDQSRKWSLDQDHDTNNRIWLCEFCAPEKCFNENHFWSPRILKSLLKWFYRKHWQWG